MAINSEQRQLRQQTANRMTVFCLISLALGAYIIWVNGPGKSMDTATTILPLTVVAFVHLLGGSIAVFNAVKTRNVSRNLPIYTYFLLVLAIAIWIVYSNVNRL